MNILIKNSKKDLMALTSALAKDSKEDELAKILKDQINVSIVLLMSIQSELSENIVSKLKISLYKLYKILNRSFHMVNRKSSKIGFAVTLWFFWAAFHREEATKMSLKNQLFI